MHNTTIHFIAMTLATSALASATLAKDDVSDKDQQWRATVKDLLPPHEGGSTEVSPITDKDGKPVNDGLPQPSPTPQMSTDAFGSADDIIKWVQSGAPLALGGSSQSTPVLIRRCPTEPPPGEGGLAGGGMTGNGWDGAGQNAATLTWHMINTSADTSWGAQRNALIAAMQAWSGVVQISFVELPVSGQNAEVDWSYQSGNHCGAEPAECGDPDCPFNGAGGVLAHAAFPPGANSACGGVLAETFCGNVHFDEAETWEQNSEGAAGSFSLTLIATHELGHGLGLVHSGDNNDVMRPTFSDTDTFVGLNTGDIENIRAGYATGTGTVTTLESTGVWVNWAYNGTQLGTFSQPFNNSVAGVIGVPPGNNGVTLHIQAGTYLQTFYADKRMTIRAENGTVKLGGN